MIKLVTITEFDFVFGVSFQYNITNFFKG